MTDIASRNNLYYEVLQYNNTDSNIEANYNVNSIAPIIDKADDYQTAVDKAKIPLGTIPLTNANIGLQEYEVTLFSGDTTSSAYLRQLNAINGDYVYNITSAGYFTKQKYTSAGVLTLITGFQLPGLASVGPMTIDNYENIYVAGNANADNFVYNTLFIYDKDGNPLQQLNYGAIQALYLGPNQGLYIADEALSGAVVYVYSNNNGRASVALTLRGSITQNYAADDLTALACVCAGAGVVIVGYNMNNFTVYDEVSLVAQTDFNEPTIDTLGNSAAMIINADRFAVYDQGFTDDIVYGVSGDYAYVANNNTLYNGQWNYCPAINHAGTIGVGIGTESHTWQFPITAGAPGANTLINDQLDLSGVFAGVGGSFWAFNGPSGADEGLYYLSADASWQPVLVNTFEGTSGAIVAAAAMPGGNLVLGVQGGAEKNLQMSRCYPQRGNFGIFPYQVFHRNVSTSTNLQRSDGGISISGGILYDQTLSNPLLGYTDGYYFTNGTNPATSTGFIVLNDVSGSIDKYGPDYTLLDTQALAAPATAIWRVPTLSAAQYNNYGYIAVYDDVNIQLSFYDEASLTLQGSFSALGANPTNVIFACAYTASAEAFFAYNYTGVATYVRMDLSNPAAPAVIGSAGTGLYLFVDAVAVDYDSNIYVIEIEVDGTYDLVKYTPSGIGYDRLPLLENISVMDQTALFATGTRIMGSNARYGQIYWINADGDLAVYTLVSGALGLVQMSLSQVGSKPQNFSLATFSDYLYTFEPVTSNLDGNLIGVAVSPTNPNAIFGLKGDGVIYKGYLSGSRGSQSIDFTPTAWSAYESINAGPGSLTTANGTVYNYSIQDQSNQGTYASGKTITSLTHNGVTEQYLIACGDDAVLQALTSDVSLVWSDTGVTGINWISARDGSDIDAGPYDIYNTQAFINALNVALLEAYNGLPAGTFTEAPSVTLDYVSGLLTLHYSADYTVAGVGITFNAPLLKLCYFYNLAGTLILTPNSTSETQTSKTIYQFNQLDKILFLSDSIYVFGSLYGNNAFNNVITDIDIDTSTFIDNIGESILYQPTFLRPYIMSSPDKLQRFQMSIRYAYKDGTTYQLYIAPADNWTARSIFPRRY